LPIARLTDSAIIRFRVPIIDWQIHDNQILDSRLQIPD